MRLSEVFLNGYGINPKNIRPAQLLDIIDGMLVHSSINNTIGNIKQLSKLEFNGDVTSLDYLSKDIILAKILSNDKATKLYLKLIVPIMLGTTIEIIKEDLSDILEGITNQNAQYKAINKTVEVLNNTLDGTIIVYIQYSDKIKFCALKGNTEQELMKSLSESGLQSPVMIDKLHTIMIVKGII